MDQAPSNGEAVASTQGRLGYEAYFAQLPEPQEDRQRRYDPSHAPESGSEPDTHTAAATAETAARHVVSAEPGVTEQSSIPMLAASAPLIGEPPFTSLHTIDLGNVSKENESQSGSRSADGAHAVHGGARAYSRQHSVTDAHAGFGSAGRHRVAGGSPATTFCSVCPCRRRAHRGEPGRRHRHRADRDAPHRVDIGRTARRHRREAGKHS